MSQTQVFLKYQSLLHSIAFGILKCKSEAEDAVHDAFIKWYSMDGKQIQNAKAYLVATVKNLSLNRIKSLSFGNKESLDQLPDSRHALPAANENLNFDAEIELRKAIKIIHSKLEPLERLIVVLREVLNFDYETLTRIAGKKADNCRQILSRARKKITALPLGEEISKAESSFEKIFMNSFRTGVFKDLVNHLKAELPKRNH